MRICIGSPKGGAGKTTTAAHLALGFSRLGPTLLVDCDPEQAQALGWSERADDWPADRCTVIHCATRDLARRVSPMLNNYAHVLFDMGAKNLVLLRQALGMSDFLVVPSKATDGDLLEVEKVFEIAAEVDAVHPIRPVVLLTQLRGGTNEEAEGRAFLAELGLPVMASGVALRRRFGQMRYAPVDDLGDYEDVLQELVEMAEVTA